MTATQAFLQPEIDALHVEGNYWSENLDYLANQFLDSERRAAQAYDNAFTLDLPVEHLRERLIGLALKFGAPNGADAKVLRGREHELLVKLASSRVVDHDAIMKFRYTLIRGRHTGALNLPSIFAGCVRYSLTQDAPKILAGMKLSNELRELYGRCERVTTNPILTVKSLPG